MYALHVLQVIAVCSNKSVRYIYINCFYVIFKMYCVEPFLRTSCSNDTIKSKQQTKHV